MCLLIVCPSGALRLKFFQQPGHVFAQPFHVGDAFCVVFHLADHISVLAEGKLLAEGTPAEIAANETVQNAYLGKAE